MALSANYSVMEFDINYLAVVGAALAAMVVGMLWHGPLFGKYWMKLSGFTKDSMKDMSLTANEAMVGGVLTSLLKAFVLAHFAIAFAATGVMGAFTIAFWLWLGFIAPIIANGWLWEGKPFKLFLFNIVHGFVEIFAMALVIVLWT